jgi:hypothetical protein
MEELLMRRLSWTLLAALCIAPVLSAQSDHLKVGTVAAAPASIANTADPAIAAVVSAVMPRVANWGTVKGVPFSATQTTVREQTLSDGTVIRSTVEVLLYRDSEGRMRAESTLQSGVAPQGRVVTVWNPLEGKAITWVTGNQAANFASVIHLPESQLNSMMGALASAPAAAQSSALSRSSLALSSSASQEAANIHTESLSQETIAGLEVTGTRTTQVVPAGSIDNDRDFTVTSETWSSPELKTAVRQTSSDPRTGTVTTELSNIDRSEPDAALFKLPAGSRVLEIPDPTAAGSGLKR